MIKIFYAMDECDAVAPALKIFRGIAKEENEKLNGPGMQITHTPTLEQQFLARQGGLGENFVQGMYLWRNGRLIAMFTIVRDDKNWSVCVFNDLRGIKQ